ncbi:uncharacterized protein RHO25_012946 [Cercospora beticola]|uniref:CFEM domain-containing protein n=1 Tax=Cercospora beticola TaxID=122368 RepID=A0ABZ0P9Q6_CERBT|nr:hypothetical protein RHO25_012946 [Cercospora beticola]CAK1367840.1 unnamed protein product [Cercospora beticola]
MSTLVLFTLLASVALALAQTQMPGLPECAQGCITDSCGCNQVDLACICSNTQLIDNLSCCVSENCDQSGQDEVFIYVDVLCDSYGGTTLPTDATCAATASGRVTTTAVDPRPSTAVNTDTITSAPATSLSTTMEFSTSETATDVESSETTSTTSASTNIRTTSTAATTSSDRGLEATPLAYTGAGARATAVVGMLGAMVIGALAP